jgi:hypothetical protein
MKSRVSITVACIIVTFSSMADRLPPPNSPFILSPIPEFINPVRYWGDLSLPAEIDPAETLAKRDDSPLAVRPRCT